MKLLTLLLAVCLLLISPLTMAAFDVTGAVTDIGLITAGIALIGAAKLAPAAVAVGWKWLKATVFS